MSTSSEDTASPSTPDEASESPETPETPETSPTTESPETPGTSATTEPSPASEAFLQGQPAPHRDSLFGAGTFSVAGLIMLATTLLSTQLVGIFNTQTLIGAKGTLGAAVQGELTGAGLFSALAVLCSAVALFRSGPETHPWVRHLAAGTVLVGILLIVLTVLSYVLLTAPAPAG
ncbi:hypothetical protein [Nocardiopsis sp. SBT366]|uniref:hypothetical protein n=1 Tax=Nocardiopsis sp. SBT366 TaxID=1580529 RepID=UPI00066E3C76|nr:hypothetical protein [Nocardiopsis sp. SBT366]